MPSEIAVPFRLDENNRIAVVSNPDTQIRQHVMALVNTAPGERVVAGDYGVPIVDVLFEDDDDQVASDLAADLSARMARFEPGVTLRDVRAVPGVDGSRRFDVVYERADAPGSSDFTRQHANVAVISEAGQVSEVVRG